VGQCVKTCALNHDVIESLPLSYRCRKQTDHGRVVDITRIPTSGGRLAVAKFYKSTM